MNVLVRILAQYIDENGKRKGGQEFTTGMDSDALLYAEDETLKTLFQRLIDTQMANFAGKYIYVEHELVFHEPVDLGDSNAAYDKLVEEIYHV
jgi:hypothetical protein